MLAVFISSLAICLSVSALVIDHWTPRLIAILVIVGAVISSVYYTFHQSHPKVASAALFIFLCNAVTPDVESAMFYWLTDFEGGPQFTSIFIGMISAGAYLAMFLGILLYNFYLSSWPYRKIFSFATVTLFFANAFDIALIMRWNLAVDIPDELLVIGDSTLSPIARRFFFLPLLILCSKVCPDGVEATLFAMLMSLANLGGAVSSLLGALLLLFFNISSDNYDNLVWVYVVKSGCRLIPLFLIWLLVPDGAPSDQTADPEPCDTGSSLDSTWPEMSLAVSDASLSTAVDPLSHSKGSSTYSDSPLILDKKSKVWQQNGDSSPQRTKQQLPVVALDSR
eukprot:gene89-89_t